MIALKMSRMNDLCFPFTAQALEGNIIIIGSIHGGTGPESSEASRKQPIPDRRSHEGWSLRATRATRKEGQCQRCE